MKNIDGKRAMLRRIRGLYREYLFFLLLLLAADAAFAFCLWLADARAYQALAGIFAVAALAIFGLSTVLIFRREKKRRRAADYFLNNPYDARAARYIEILPLREREQLAKTSEKLREEENALLEEQQMQKDYEEYIETWVHEIKIPLSLMTLLLDNRREEMSPLLYQRMLYISNQMSEYVTQILYYARLKASHKDYRFEPVSLRECCGEILEQYGTLLREEQIRPSLNVKDIHVLTDRKGLLFILAQAVSNACKYKDDRKEEKILCLSGSLLTEENAICLSIHDNGIGVKRADLPFLFDRGFTGDTDERKRKATGMGLYLAGQMAKNLHIELSVGSVYRESFTLTLKFPVVHMQ